MHVTFSHGEEEAHRRVRLHRRAAVRGRFEVDCHIPGNCSGHTGDKLGHTMYNQLDIKLFLYQGNKHGFIWKVVT